MRDVTPHIVGEEVLYQQGSYRRVRQYIAGWYPHLGMLHEGWSGKETIVERDVIVPTRDRRRQLTPRVQAA